MHWYEQAAGEASAVRERVVMISGERHAVTGGQVGVDVLATSPPRRRAIPAREVLSLRATLQRPLLATVGAMPFAVTNSLRGHMTPP